ncbi:peptidase S8/S53 domain-containing protein [Dichotomopilus funicola]|uniref:Peptidase S8/S53 domain-containing protein n=1 Tax=Dichotomopilus funicola TaxID=1934379 RepID=A0AAN6V4V4_9PEZI|nr:peptidase S8/S53 domain-containing protein [Dichotomopilus funicola]
MKMWSGAALLGLAALAATSQVLPRNWDANDYYVLHLDANTSPHEVARSLGLAHEGPLGELRHHHIFTAKRTEHDVVKRELAYRKKRRSLGERDVLDGVLFSEKQALRKPWEKRIIPQQRNPLPPDLPHNLRSTDPPVQSAVDAQADLMRKLEINDPMFAEQWHLFNTVQVGHDVNVGDVWLQGVTGKNATVAIVDDGLDMYSDDLKDNYYAAGSYDFNDKVDEPRPRLQDDKHGTRCAGEVSAVRNDVCGVGVAYDSKIAGLRILSKLISDADEAVAMNYDFQHNQIYSCSWGPPDDGKSMDAPGILIRRAMLNAVQNGRGGLGSIYVFASGNGAQNEDNCNFDGYTNSIYSITVGAIDRKGLHPYYSEKCSAGLVVTYSSGSSDAIHTTDVGQNACSNSHGGTSAAAPLAAGIFALVLQVRPDLSWRDMQYLAMDTALPVNMDTGDYQTTTIGKKFSHTYGYGKLDSSAIVKAARSWKKVKPQAWYYSPWIHVNEDIPQGDQGIAVGFEVTKDMLKDANLARLEHITVTMNVAHGRRGDISVDLISPSKVVSHLSVTRKYDESTEGYDDWTFMSVAHWGELGTGTWTIVVKDTNINEFSGRFVDWHLKLWGESLDASKAVLLPMPTEEDDNDHAVVPTTTLKASTTSVPLPGGTSPADADTTDHPNRPVNAKPTGTGTPVPPEAEESATAPASTDKPSTWLPSFLPTFGVSAATQAWIYGSLVLIVLFCAGLGVYLYLARRKRLRNNPRNDYEFELLDDDEDDDFDGGEGLAASGRGARGFEGAGAEKFGAGAGAGAGGVGAGAAAGGRKGKKRTRGGELYNAFAGDSSDEDGLADDNDFGGRGAAGGGGGGLSGGQYRDGSSGSDGSGSPIRLSEKLPAPGAGAGSRRRDSDEEDEHHVVGDSDDDEEEEESSDEERARRPLHGGNR